MKGLAKQFEAVLWPVVRLPFALVLRSPSCRRSALPLSCQPLISSAPVREHTMSFDVSSLVESSSIIVILLVPRLLALHSIPIFDDAFITFRYAEHLARGYGLVYNLNSRVLGTTTPFFAILLAGLSWLRIEPRTGALAIGIASDVFTGLFCYSILKADLGRYTAITSLSIFAIAPNFVRISVGGMESGLFLACSLLIIYLLAEKRYGTALMLAAIAVYIRPEAVVLCGLAIVGMCAEPRRNSLYAIAAGFLIFAVPLVIIWSYYGTPIPSSILAKGRHVSGGIWGVVRVFFFPVGLVQALLTLLLPFGLRDVWRRSGFCKWLLVWTSLYVAAYLIARPVVFTWYALPVYFTEAVCAAAALARFTSRLVRYVFSVERSGLATAVAISMATWSVVWLVAGTAPVTKNIDDPLRLWCERNVRASDTIAAGDIGAVGYYSGAYVYDLAGLVWPGRFKYASQFDVILAKRPKFIFAEVSDYNQALFDSQSDVGRIYSPVVRFSKLGKKSIYPTRNEFAKGWQQDYVMFVRRDSAVAFTDRPEVLAVARVH